MKTLVYLGALALAGSVIVACTGPAADLNSAPAIDGAAQSHKRVRPIKSSTNPITHVFVIVQENRSVDNLFNGFPGANTVQIGRSTGNSLVPLKPEPIATPDDLGHFLTNFNTDTGCPSSYGPSFTCPMDGFPAPSGNNPAAYAYVDHAYTKLYFAMAEAYAFGDNMFPSNIDASFVSHQYLVAAQANSAVNITGNCPGSMVSTVTPQRTLGPTESPCYFTSTTLADELSAAGLSWRYYVAPAVQGEVFWDPFYYIAQDRQSPNIIMAPSQFLTDASNSYKTTVTWITPTAKNSDHAAFTTNAGPNWVASVVNAIGTSPLWNSSVIFITWDDWGGWYDHVTPPYEDYDGLGIRVPFVIISPYTKAGLVTHTQYEQASIMKFIENRFGLPSLSAADQRAADPSADVFSTNSLVPRPFATFSVPSFSNANDPGNPDPDG